MSKTTARMFVYAALIFAGGLVTGVLTAPMLGRSFMRPPTPAQMSKGIVSMLQSRLSLTPEQTEQIKPIVDKTGEDLQGIWLDTTNRVAARLEQTNTRIAALLTPEQKPKLDALNAENRERLRKRVPFGPPAPPPH